jgi:radical SAM protein with 4Fe4S-binding SPASM domain
MITEFTPKWIAWEITRRCNLRCVHCRSSSEEEAQGHPDFSLEEAKRMLDDIASYAKPVVVLSGGEPLVRKDVFDIARYGTEKGLRMCLATNGVLVTDETCEHIKASGIKIVSLSLDGSTREVHDDFRCQEGAFDGTLRAARLFKKHGIEFIINSSFTKRNQEEIPRVYRLAKDLGATAWYMFMIVPTGRGEDIMSELISKEEYEEILDWHYDMEKEDEGEKVKHRTLKFSTGGSKGCLAGQLICLIDVDGNVLPCSYFPKAAGNVRKQSFKDVWENSELFRDMRDFKSYTGRCGSCEYVNVCGGCRARAYAMHGDYMAEEPFCTYVPMRMKRAAEARGAEKP